MGEGGTPESGKIPGERDTIDPEILARIQEYARKRPGKRARKPKT
jgi:hypothetical protein